MTAMPSEEAAMERLEAMEPLGIQRLRVLDSLYGNMPFYGHYFRPDAEPTVFGSFRSYISEAIPRWSSESDPVYVSNIAAGRLLIGDLGGADTIIDLLPVEPYKLDNGAGRGLLAAVYALCNVLPLPPELRDTDRWTSGSEQQAALRDWLARHRDRLRWREAEGDYVLDA
jgi:hypothetical protein